MTDHAGPADQADSGSTAPRPDEDGPHARLPRKRWDLVKTAWVGAGLYLVVLSAVADGPWFPLHTGTLPVPVLAFGAAAVVLLVLAQGTSLAYVTGRWNRIWTWIASAAVFIAAVLVVLRTVADSLPDRVTVPIPRTALLVGGVLSLIIGITRNTDVLHDADQATDDWFRRTGRILQATRFWSPEQADEQMRRARAEFDQVQSHRAQGTPELTPQEHFGSPELYAASVPTRPSATPDPLRGGRWYYLMSAIALGAWAAFRSLTVGMNWLTVVLYLFAVISIALFVWASVAQRRRR